MKDSEFIALLNLYLDHEISPADAARLEAEVQSNPERRKVYRQYCQMQKACKVLSHEFQTDVAAVERKVVNFNAAGQRPRTSSWYGVGAFAAAAACVAVIFVTRNREAENAAPDLSAPANAIVNAQPRAVEPATLTAREENAIARAVSIPQVVAHAPQASFAGSSFLLASASQSGSTLPSEVDQAQFAWMERVQLNPIQSHLSRSDLRYEAAPATLRTEPRTYSNRQPVEATVEMTAFRFQR